MTISTLIRKTIAAGDGATTAFNFAFQVRTAADLQVYYTDATGVQTLLAANLYGVVLNPIPSGQLWSNGGTITYPLAGAAIAAGTTLTIVRNVALLQSSSLINQGGYYADVVEAALDVLTMEVQQLSETINRALTLPISSSATTALPNPLANAAIGWDATGTFITNILGLGGIAVPVPIAQGGTSAATAPLARTALGVDTAISTAVAAVYTHGQCQLAKSGANLSLTPKNGNKLFVNGVACTVPDAGVALAVGALQGQFATTTRTIAANVATLAHAALAQALPVGSKIGVSRVGNGSAAPYNGTVTVTASSTVSTSYACVAANEGVTGDVNGLITPIYNIYATAAAGAVNAIEASVTAHSTSLTAGNKGIEIKTGDDTRTLVGMAAIVGGVWSDSLTSRLVRSWFNRTSAKTEGAFTAARSTNSATFLELNFEIRTELLMWADEALACSINGPASVAAGTGGVLAIGIDGVTTAYAGDAAFTNNAANINTQSMSEVRTGLAEGYHGLTVIAASDGVNNITAGTTAITPFSLTHMSATILKGAG